MIDQKLIKIDQQFLNKEELFTYLAELVVKEGYANNVEQVLGALKAREEEGTTGMMDGFAIPHAKSAAIQKSGIAVLKLAKSIDWPSMDGLAIKFVIALFIPETEATTTHLQLLSRLARLLMQETFKTSFKKTESVEEIETLLKRELSESGES